MDGEADLPVPTNLVRPVCSSDLTSSSSSSSSSPDFLRNVQAAFKRHRPIGKMQSNRILPKRILVPQREALRSSAADVGSVVDAKRSYDAVPSSQGHIEKGLNAQMKNAVAVGETKEDASINPLIIPSTITKTFDENFKPFNVQSDCPKTVIGCKDYNSMPPSRPQHVDGQKDVQLSNNAASQEIEWDVSNQVEVSTVVNNNPKHRNFQNAESDVTLRPDGGISSSLAKRTTVVQDQLHQFRNFFSQPVTQSSVVGSSYATTTSIHSSSAPMLNPTTFSSRSDRDGGTHVALEPPHATQGDILLQSCPATRGASGIVPDQTSVGGLVITSAVDIQREVIKCDTSKEQRGNLAKEIVIPKIPSHVGEGSIKGKGLSGDVTDGQSRAPLSKQSFSDVKVEASTSVKQEKVISGKGASVHRKRNYDPDLFFKVNGKLYQRLGKIGSGGSSEVHKVISSDCTIYALKKIKLKGRDYATAYGFCQEIEYLNKLKGKNNIIQLTDYEVTDKTLLREVMSGSMTNKDGRVKDDGCIYMVLEYGEIDLAHMLSQKWKEIGSSDQTIDENWLRFYWQQILQAVNTIHKERIVHSDLKPANFLLVKGSLKLIDFGIAKAIMSDTTNIQRDSQVGTLSYMSPEAFMCNENDANGNMIKCGRPSDIWSLGCILYQMVYGRTPFSEYKTFWAKFKVITDPNHVITYEPVSNPWLLDLMKKCLAWDRNERWRIPQLLQHPFLVPPVTRHVSSSQDESYKLLQCIAEACASDPEMSNLYSQLRQLLTSQPLTTQDQQCKLLSQMSMLCFQLQERLANPKREQGKN